MNSLPQLPLALGFGSGMEWVIIAVIVLVLFGGKKIPELMRGVGKGVGELQKGLDEGKSGFANMMHSDDHATPAAPTATPTTTTVSSAPTNPPTA